MIRAVVFRFVFSSLPTFSLPVLPSFSHSRQQDSPTKKCFATPSLPPSVPPSLLRLKERP
jgi:hypothetical protein